MSFTSRRTILAAAALACLAARTTPAHASAASISASSRAALRTLYRANPTAKLMGEKAKAILVFPKILKAGFIFGAQGGEGAMFQGGKTTGYYRTLAASYGFQAGVQSFGYALFFMDNGAIDYLKKSKGWEIGTGPSVVIVDEGLAKSLTTTTLKDDVYAVIFDQKGLMAGMGIQGSKITRIHPK
jgi:lipid-binding SYLF domain-containing protein